MSTENSYTRNELKILWHAKKNGGSVEKRSGLVAELVAILDMREATVGYILRNLEKRCILLRSWAENTYRKSIVIKIELCDPGMWLPPLPPPLPLAAVVANENEELRERTIHEPSNEAIILALLERNEELRKQVDRLHDIIIGQEQEVETLKKQVTRATAPRSRPEHLTHRLKDALTPEKWDELEH